MREATILERILKASDQLKAEAAALTERVKKLEGTEADRPGTQKRQASER